VLLSISSSREARLTMQDVTSVVSFVSECCFESCSGLLLLLLLLLLLHRLLLQLLMIHDDVDLDRAILVGAADIAKPFRGFVGDGRKGALKFWPPSNLGWRGWTMILYSTNLCRVCCVITSV
jgi:hypothetical protein